MNCVTCKTRVPDSIQQSYIKVKDWTQFKDNVATRDYPRKNLSLFFSSSSHGTKDRPAPL